MKPGHFRQGMLCTAEETLHAVFHALESSFVSDARPELTVRLLAGIKSSSEALVSCVGCIQPFPLSNQTCSYIPFDGINLVRPNLPKTKS